MRCANYEHIGKGSEPEMMNLTHDVRAYSQNILQEVLLLTKHSNSLRMIVGAITRELRTVATILSWKFTPQRMCESGLIAQLCSVMK